MRYPALAVTVISGLAMVSRFRYPSFKGGKKKGQREDRVPFMMIFALVVAIIGVVIDPPKVLFAVFAAFLLLGPLISRRIRKAAAEG